MIRKAQSRDCAALAMLHGSLFPRGWPEETFEDYCRSPQHVVMVCERDDALCGLIVVQLIIDEGEILTVGVSRDVQAQGIGEALLRQAFAELMDMGVHSIFLDVAQSNLPAYKLYSKLGFAQIGRREGYYMSGDTPEAALVMRCQLKMA